jgi:uncharacterized Fe-S cluster-containing radical SAM superfamily protein
MSTGIIDTDTFSADLRARAIDLAHRRVRMTTLPGSQQENDLTLPPNCHGFGRIHHFRRVSSDGWPDNPLPIDPACRALEMQAGPELAAQVFQNAICNWRCWYCYVDFKLLSAHPQHSSFVSADELVRWYLQIPDRPVVIDLSGGQPDLVPEWTVWMMRALTERKIDKSVFLWGDDNLSNDYFWQFLAKSEREEIASYPNYGRVCCFKGFDCESFSFNTRAAPDLYMRQLELFNRLLSTGIDLYAYVTLTGPSQQNISDKIARFMDELQRLHPNLPLRTVPLEIRLFSPVRSRMTSFIEANKTQKAALAAWTAELEDRFSANERAGNICDVSLS